MRDQFNILKSIRLYALPMHVHDMGSVVQKCPQWHESVSYQKKDGHVIPKEGWARHFKRRMGTCDGHVIQKEGWAHVAILLLVWHRLFKNIIYDINNVKFWKVGVILKEGWARPQTPDLLLGWLKLRPLWTFLCDAAHIKNRTPIAPKRKQCINRRYLIHSLTFDEIHSSHHSARLALRNFEWN